MINLNEPNYYGIGKGAAQVIDLSQINNMYNRLLQTRMLQEQKDAAAINEMVSQYDPNKQDLRAEDIKDYNDKFSQWKTLYLQNKNLARNPASNPDLYKKAEQLRNEMGVLAKESKETYHTLGEISSKYKQNENAFDQSAVQKMNLYRSLPTSEIKRVNGGQLPQWGDFELKYNPIDDKAATEYVKKQAVIAGLKPKEETEVLKVGDGKNGLNLYENQIRVIEKYPPEFIGHLADTYALSYPNEIKSYNQQFRNMPPENVAAVQQQLKKDFGVDMEIKDGRGLQHATWIMKYGKQWAGDVVRKDQAKIDAAEEAKYQKHRAEKNADKQASDYRQDYLIRKRAKSNPQDEGIGYVDAYDDLENEISEQGAAYKPTKLNSKLMSVVSDVLKEDGSRSRIEDVFVSKGKDGKIRVYRQDPVVDKKNKNTGRLKMTEEQLITTIDKEHFNVLANKNLSIDRRNEASGTGKKKPSKGSKKYKGIDAEGNPIFE